MSKKRAMMFVVLSVIIVLIVIHSDENHEIHSNLNELALYRTQFNETIEMNKYDEHKTQSQYGFTSNDICSSLSAEHIVFASHHKTGTSLVLRKIGKEIQHFLRRQCNDSIHKIVINPQISTKYINNLIINKSTVNNEDDSDNIIYIVHSIRDPVDTILSSYNFHKTYSTEHWTSTYTVTKLGLIAERNLHYGGFDRIVCAFDLFKNGKFYDFTRIQNYSIKQLHNQIWNVEQGLYFEYLRYLHCEFVELYPVYCFINDEMDKKNKIKACNIGLEEFANDYNGTCSKLIQFLGIPMEQNLKLLNKLNKFDIYNNNNNDNNTHVTRNKYNKTYQINMLLNNTQEQCVKIKNMTILLKSSWKYVEYC